MSKRFEERTTLDLYHKNQLSNIQEKIQDISGLYIQREGLTELISNCKDEILLGQYETRLHIIQKEIDSLEKGEPVYDYFLKTGSILFDYYDIQEKIASGEIVENHKVSKSKPGNVLSALTEAARKDGLEERGGSLSQTLSQTPTATIAKPIHSVGRETLLEQYLEIMDTHYKKKQVSEIEDTTGECELCGEEMIFSCKRSSEKAAWDRL